MAMLVYQRVITKKWHDSIPNNGLVFLPTNLFGSQLKKPMHFFNHFAPCSSPHVFVGSLHVTRAIPPINEGVGPINNLYLPPSRKVTTHSRPTPRGPSIFCNSWVFASAVASLSRCRNSGFSPPQRTSHNDSNGFVEGVGWERWRKWESDMGVSKNRGNYPPNHPF